MSVRVFEWNCNEAVDQASYHLSNIRANQFLAENRGYLISTPNGKAAIKKFPPEEMRIKHGGYSDAWKMIPSGGIPVWQMVRT